MRFILIGIISLLFFSSKAQVKEVQFLGKNWYLHGIDARLILPNYKTNATLKAFKKTHQQLFSAIENEYNYSDSIFKKYKVSRTKKGSLFSQQASFIFRFKFW
jgi:patatin-like phospholipase/acyl hydrolase